MKIGATPATVLLAITGLVYALLLAILRRTDPGPPTDASSGKKWWFGYARDAVSLWGFLSLSGGLALAGMSGPFAFFGGAILALAGYGLDHLFAASLRREPAATALTVSLVILAAGAGLLHRPFERGLSAVVKGLF